MNDYLTRASLDEPPKTFRHIRMLNFEKGGFHQSEPASLRDPACDLTNVSICLRPPASMAND
jgi:hypothetical protein